MKAILVLIFSLVLFSCSRDNDLPTPNTTDADREISFMIDGTNKSYKGQQTTLNGGVGVHGFRMLGTPGFTSTVYGFNGNNGVENSILINILTGNDTLKLMNYRVTTGLHMIRVAGQNYQTLGPGDFIDINITTYSNGEVSGTFGGKISKMTNNGSTPGQSVNVTNGVIKNVKIVY